MQSCHNGNVRTKGFATIVLAAMDGRTIGLPWFQDNARAVRLVHGGGQNIRSFNNNRKNLYGLRLILLHWTGSGSACGLHVGAMRKRITPPAKGGQGEREAEANQQSCKHRRDSHSASTLGDLSAGVKHGLHYLEVGWRTGNRPDEGFSHPEGWVRSPSPDGPVVCALHA